MASGSNTVAPIRRSQAERRDESERNLLAATWSVIASRGVNAATFEAIGQAAGYSRGLATQRFGSKQGLIDAVIAHAHSHRDSMLEADHVAEMSGMDALIYYADSHLRNLRDQPDGRAYFMLLAGAVADSAPAREAFAQSHERVRLWLEDMIRRGQSEGDIRPDMDPTAGALMVGSLLLGLSIQWLVDPQTNLDLLRQTIVAALRQSYAADESADGAGAVKTEGEEA
jgi:AcrR family transcriptional regulator